MASLRSVGISLDLIVGSAYSGAALASDRNPSRILSVALVLIFTGEVSLLVILWNKKLLPKTGGLKLSVLYFDPVILSDTSIDIETSWGFLQTRARMLLVSPFSSS